MRNVLPKKELFRGRHRAKHVRARGRDWPREIPAMNLIKSKSPLVQVQSRQRINFCKKNEDSSFPADSGCSTEQRLVIIANQ